MKKGILAVFAVTVLIFALSTSAFAFPEDGDIELGFSASVVHQALNAEGMEEDLKAVLIPINLIVGYYATKKHEIGTGLFVLSTVRTTEGTELTNLLVNPSGFYRYNSYFGTTVSLFAGGNIGIATSVSETDGADFTAIGFTTGLQFGFKYFVSKKVCVSAEYDPMYITMTGEGENKNDYNLEGFGGMFLTGLSIFF